jgi:hypothetical protein
MPQLLAVRIPVAGLETHQFHGVDNVGAFGKIDPATTVWNMEKMT